MPTSIVGLGHDLQRLRQVGGPESARHHHAPKLVGELVEPEHGAADHACPAALSLVEVVRYCRARHSVCPGRVGAGHLLGH
eukprot:2365933-Pyramimonas_sp.AAC.1